MKPVNTSVVSPSAIVPSSPIVPSGVTGTAPLIVTAAGGGVAPARRGGRRKYGYLRVSNRERRAKVDLRDYEKMRRITWFTNNNGYIAGTNSKAIGGNGRIVYLHTMILGRREGHVVDHIDGDPLNCTRGNLRHVTCFANAANHPGIKKSKSGIRGVFPTYGKWMVGFQHRYRKIPLGRFNTRCEAKRVADAGIALLYGRCTRLTNNQPFERRHIAKIVSGLSSLSPKQIREILCRTWGCGDELSALLRRRLMSTYAQCLPCLPKAA